MGEGIEDHCRSHAQITDRQPLPCTDAVRETRHENAAARDTNRLDRLLQTKIELRPTQLAQGEWQQE